MGFFQVTTFLHEEKRYKAAFSHGHLISFPLRGPLPSKAINILSKPPRERNALELSYLSSISLQLEPLWSYPRDVRIKVARILHYHSLEKGEVAPGGERADDTYLYFILTGQVYTAVTEDSEENGCLSVIKEPNVCSGCSVGDLRPLTNKESIIVVCKSKTTLLRISVSDFNDIVRVSFDREWVWRLNIVQSHPFFNQFSDPAIAQSFAEASKFINFPPRSVIIKDLSKTGDFAYLLVHGEATVLHKLKIRETYDWRNGHQRLLVSSRERGAREGCDSFVVRKWIHIRDLLPGEIFGIGEGKPNMSIISRHYAKCLAINKQVLLKYEHTINLPSLVHEISLKYPSTAAVFEKYVEVCKWKDYKRVVVRDAILRK